AARFAGPLNLFLAAVCALAFVVWALMRSIHNWNWETTWEYRRLFLSGWLMTLVLSAGALVASLLLGTVVAVLRGVRFRPLAELAHLYVEVVRGTPLLVILLVGYYGVARAVGLEDRYVTGVLILAFFSGAYISEIIRGGFGVVGASLIESAKAVGFSRWQIFRFVTLPLATRNILPALTGQFALLVKDSSLLSVIAVSEFTMNAQQVASRTFSHLESYLPLAVGYLVITLPISMLARRLERQLHYET
ncbi:MAG: amino acid ABC transporter permease, partial [Verrucomicrobiia bacterium]